MTGGAHTRAGPERTEPRTTPPRTASQPSVGFFDFLAATPRYAEHPSNLRRLNVRHEHLVAPHAHDLRGARVLDLASRDGRWPYAFAAAGAREVVGVEARAEMIAQFDAYPADEVQSWVELRHADVFDELPRLVAAGERFDVVAVLGLLYHVMDHYRLLTLVTSLRPRLVIVDSEFALATEAVIRLGEERTASHLNSIAVLPDQERATVGVPSRRALETMARTLGYAVEWTDWSDVPRGQRAGLKAYIRSEQQSWKRRGSCVLRPAGEQVSAAASAG